MKQATKKAAPKGRYTVGRSMADVRHAILSKGDGAAQWLGNTKFVAWSGPNGMRAFIENMDERAAARKGGPIKK